MTALLFLLIVLWFLAMTSFIDHMFVTWWRGRHESSLGWAFLTIVAVFALYTLLRQRI